MLKISSRDEALVHPICRHKVELPPSVPATRKWIHMPAEQWKRKAPVGCVIVIGQLALVLGPMVVLLAQSPFG